MDSKNPVQEALQAWKEAAVEADRKAKEYRAAVQAEEKAWSAFLQLRDQLLNSSGNPLY